MVHVTESQFYPSAPCDHRGDLDACCMAEYRPQFPGCLFHVVSSNVHPFHLNSQLVTLPTIVLRLKSPLKRTPFCPTLQLSLMLHLLLTRTSQNPRLAPFCMWCLPRLAPFCMWRLHGFHLVYFSSYLHPCHFFGYGSHQVTNLVLVFFFPLS